MVFCTECGANVSAGLRFCTGCGAAMAAGPVPEAQGTAPVAAMPAQAAPQPPYPAPQAVYPAPQQAPPPQPPAARAPHLASAAPPRGSQYAVLGTGAFFGLMLLFCIPVIGWVACVVMAFAGGNQNRRHFARAMLIFILIGIALSAALYFVSSWVIEVWIEVIAEGIQSSMVALGG